VAFNLPDSPDSVVWKHMSRKHVTRYPRESCYFCGADGPIETHHIVPSRYNGSDSNENLVDLCSNCHKKLEQLYDQRFYNRVAIAEPDGPHLSRAALERMAHIQSEVFLDKGISEFDENSALLERMADEFDLDVIVCHACHRIATPTDTKDGAEWCKCCGTKVDP